MFNLSAWLTQSLIDGTNSGLFAREYVAVKVADCTLKGVLSPEQAETVAVETAPPEPPVELDPITGLEVPNEIVKP